MNCNYDDILTRIQEKPRWWDERAVPRFCAPHPENSSNIYADQVGFYGIECQGCGTPFLVEMTATRYEPRHEDPTRWHYGDPPNNGCCGPGPTMNSVPRLIVAFWTLHRGVTALAVTWEKTMENVPLDPEWHLEHLAHDMT